MQAPVVGKLPPVFSSRWGSLGNLLALSGDPTDFFLAGYKAHGPVFTLPLGFKKAAVLMGPEAHRVFFTQTDETLSINEAYKFLLAMFGEVGVTAPPATYNRQRPVMQAVFKASKMPVYVQAMETEVQRWLEGLGDTGQFELVRELTGLVQKIAGAAILGPTFNEQVGDRFWALYSDLARGVDLVLPPNLPLPKFRRRDKAKQELQSILRPLIAERRRNPEGHDDFLQELVSAPDVEGKVLEEDAIIRMIIAMLFAGHETTVGQAAWTLIELLRHPEYARHVRAEMEEHLRPGEALTVERLRALNHLGWALKESERMHPSVHLLMRVVKEDTQVGDYRIPTGWMAMVSPAAAHRTELFPDGDSFRPLRFAPGGSNEQVDRFGMIGFGGGRHKCAGMNFATHEMALIIALLLRRFELELVTLRPVKDFSNGAPRPSPTLIQYTRRQR